MHKNPQHTEEIEAYLSGELAPEHLAEFEKRVREDQDLEEELRLTKMAINGVFAFGFKEMLKKIHSDLFNEDGSPKENSPPNDSQAS